MNKSILAALASGVTFASSLTAQSFVFDDFDDTSPLTLNGSAQAVHSTDGNVVRLVGGTTPQSGSVFFSVPVDISGFSTAFEFRISNSGGQQDWHGEAGGDGLVFVMQGQGATALGDAGHNLGYNSITPSVGVEFDTYDNGFLSDTDSNHLAILEDGIVDHSLVPWNFPISVAPRFDDGNKWFVWVDYDGSNLEIRTSQNGVRPDLPKVDTNIFFTSLMDPMGSQTAYVGFTAAQWNAWGDCDLIRWEFGPANSILLLNPLSPGTAGVSNTISIENGTPAKKVFLAYGYASGKYPLSMCPGLSLDIYSPKLVSSLLVDGSGNASQIQNLPPGVAGKLIVIQAVEVSTCRISNAITQVIQ